MGGEWDIGERLDRHRISNHNLLRRHILCCHNLEHNLFFNSHIFRIQTSERIKRENQKDSNDTKDNQGPEEKAYIKVQYFENGIVGGILNICKAVRKKQQ